MVANFIESNPMPVKALLAMMGKIEEVYRLPMLPMRRDTRSKLQKIAADVGLISKPAAPVTEAADFYVYENWLAGPHKIVLHRSGLQPVQSRQRTARGPRRESCTLARTLFHAFRSTRSLAAHGGRADSKRVQVHLRIQAEGLPAD